MQLSLKCPSPTLKEEKEFRNFIFHHRRLLNALMQLQFIFLRYYLEIKTHTLSFPGCRHACMKEFEQPECCQGHWGPDCMGKLLLDVI